MIRKVRNCCKTCENLVCIATTIGQLQHFQYLKPTFLDTFKSAIRPVFPETVTYVIKYITNHFYANHSYYLIYYVCTLLNRMAYLIVYRMVSMSTSLLGGHGILNWSICEVSYMLGNTLTLKYMLKHSRECYMKNKVRGVQPSTLLFI